MNKKLTIDILLEELNNWKPQDPMELIHIGQKQMVMILDYITNLQQKEKLLKVALEQTDKAYKDYKLRCKRAIEIIDIYGCYNSITEDKLYSCLRGEDNEL